ncbi:MAG: hypothetical protein L3J34_11785 [Flavobacteriaceae bacterium]|nr:hypothetical protein [Flavobacteriaceae bacterium]
MQDLRKRFVLYGFGFAMGIGLVFLFLGGKKASCNWLPNDRMLQIIRSKQINYSLEVQNKINTAEIDSIKINLILDNGDIDFSKSQTENNPCRKYIIYGIKELKNVSLSVEVCDSIATIKKIFQE